MSSKVTYRFEDTNTGEIFGEVEVDREADFTITTVEQPPEANPLHERALPLDDLYMGQEIWVIDTSNRHNQVPATIISKPFRRPHEPPSSLFNGVVYVRVVDDHGVASRELWNLAHKGIVPFHPLHEGDATRWSKVHYVLSATSSES